MLENSVKDNYNINIKSIELIVDHVEATTYMLTSEDKKYVLKTIPSYKTQTEEEGLLTQFLYENGMKVARLLKNNSGSFIAHDGQTQFQIQEFIEGDVFQVNSASDWFLEKSARYLGQMQKALSKYKKLPSGLGEEFVSKSHFASERRNRLEQLDLAKEKMNDEQICYFKKRLRHFDRISSFEFDMNKLTSSNSHGDYYIGQVICNNGDITVIDWEMACYLPLCLEVILSYTYASPACKDGVINLDNFKKYLNEYSKYMTLNRYDLAAMPYFYYYYLTLTSFHPPYDGLSEDYLKIAHLMDNLMNWLYDHVDDFSKALCL